MVKLCIFIGVTVFGWAGWYLGAQYGFLTAFLLSGAGSLLGVYVGWRVGREYLE